MSSTQAGVWLTTSVLFCVGRTEIFVMPPDSRALTFFGRYASSVSLRGWHWSNPFAMATGDLAAMVSNLIVALISAQSAQSVVNTATLQG